MSATKDTRAIRVIGHQNPDTDSICSAISYAYLKNQLNDGLTYEPARAGSVNRETQFVLEHFGVEAPRLVTDVSPQIKDIDIRQQSAVDKELSLREAYMTMRDAKIDTLCVTGAEQEVLGVITIADIANVNMDLLDTGLLAQARTSYKNLIKTLDAQMVLGKDDDIIDRGSIVVGTSPEMMEKQVKDGDIVLVTERYETQSIAIECGASCIIICNAKEPLKTIVSRAAEKGCAILTTSYDTFAASRLISMAAPIGAFMKRSDLITFSVNTFVDDAQKVMASVRHRYFPITDAQGRYCGVISRRNFLNLHKKRVCLVDHNERTQSVDGIDEAVILEIIDHHRIGTLETGGPVYFRNEPVGCTCTIVYRMFKECGVDIPEDIAGLMLSAILSDTLTFKSPTSTPSDERAAEDLAAICGEDIKTYADAMFEAGGDITGKTAEEVFESDFKIFITDNIRFGVGQGSYLSRKNMKDAIELVQPYLPQASLGESLPFVFYMCTDIKNDSTDLVFFGDGADDLVKRAFNVEVNDGIAVLPGVVSRKKQLLPPLMNAIHTMSD